MRTTIGNCFGKQKRTLMLLAAAHSRAVHCYVLTSFAAVLCLLLWLAGGASTTTPSEYDMSANSLGKGCCASAGGVVTRKS